MHPLEKEVWLLKIYAGIATIVCAVLFATLFTRSNRFREINVERINVVESDGKLRMVISNKVRQHPGTVDGITYEERKGLRPPGMLFFSEKGDEVGGLVFDGNTGQGQGGSLTFDKFRGDQTIQFLHDENKEGAYFAGLKMSDQNLPLNDLMAKQKEIAALPTQEARDAAYKNLREQSLLMTERLKIGKDHDRSSVIKMMDAKGRIRIELKVEAAGNPRIEFYDEAGKVIQRLPGLAKGRN